LDFKTLHQAGKENKSVIVRLWIDANDQESMMTDVTRTAAAYMLQLLWIFLRSS
jgi:hypothetical protein